MHTDNAEDLLEDAAADFVGDPLRCLGVVVHVDALDAGELAALDQVGRMNGFLWKWQSGMSGEHVAQGSIPFCTSIARALYDF